MKNYELLDAVGGLDPRLVADASETPVKAKRPVWRTLLPVAACFCLAVGTLAALKLSGVLGGAEDPKSAMTGDKPGAAIITETTGGNSASEATEATTGATTGGEVSGANEAMPTYPGSWSFLTDNGQDHVVNTRVFISSYPGEKDTEHPVIVAGQVCLSPALRAAIDEYDAIDENGNEIIYNVCVELYEGVCQLIPCVGDYPPVGDEPLGDVKAEALRLFNEAGIISVWSTLVDESKGECAYSLYLHATAEQLTNFPVSERYGYYIKLYGEALDEHGEPDIPVVFNGIND